MSVKVLEDAIPQELQETAVSSLNDFLQSAASGRVCDMCLRAATGSMFAWRCSYG